MTFSLISILFWFQISQCLWAISCELKFKTTILHVAAWRGDWNGSFSLGLPKGWELQGRQPCFLWDLPPLWLLQLCFQGRVAVLAAWVQVESWHSWSDWLCPCCSPSLGQTFPCAPLPWLQCGVVVWLSWTTAQCSLPWPYLIGPLFSTLAA